MNNLKKALIAGLLTVFAVGMTVNLVTAHGGGLNRAGCHNDNVHGGYHCH